MTQRQPRFLPDDVNGHRLFEIASERRRARNVAGLGDIVMVGSVREARDRGILHARDMFIHLHARGVRFKDGPRLDVDTGIWRTASGQRSTTSLREADGLIATDGETQALKGRRLHLMGYGDWTASASATVSTAWPP